MKNIHVRRYNVPKAGFAGWIEPEDRSWLVFVDVDGQPLFFRRVSSTTLEGKTEEHFADVELPCSQPLPDDQEAVPSPYPTQGQENPLDYRVVPMGEEPDWATVPDDDLGDVDGAGGGYIAFLNARKIAYQAESPHEAVRGLMNCVAQLCTAGSLDHTGQPSLGNKRRYEYVYGSQR